MIVFDTNALLDIYLFTDDSTEKIIDYLTTKIKDIFVPHQVYEEFIKHYQERRQRSNKNISALNKTIDRQCDKISQILKSFAVRHKRYESNLGELIVEAQKYFIEQGKKFKQETTEIKTKYHKNINDDNDIVFDFVKTAYAQNTSRPYSIMQKVDFVKEAKIRFELDLAPGFTDANKDLSKFEPYGDYFIWREILRELARKSQNLSFITNEKKIDWWKNEEKKEPAKVLQEEYRDLVPDASFGFFMSNLNDFLLSEIDDPALNTEINEKVYLIKKLRNYKNKDVLFRDNVKNILYEKIDDIVVQNLLVGEGCNGGSINEVDSIEPELIDIIIQSVDFDDYDYTFEVAADFIYICNGYCDLYFSRDYCESHELKIKLKQSVVLSYSVFLDSAIDDNFDECIDFEDVLIDDLELIEYDLVYKPEDYMDDYEEEGYTSCPECGKNITHENDGGNGFCCHCAHNH